MVMLPEVIAPDRGVLHGAHSQQADAQDGDGQNQLDKGEATLSV